MAEEFAVELRDVVKRFGTVVAVNHVTVHIRDGEFFSLLGPSGCGKTTTLRMIAGFEMPSSGEIYIGGQYQGYLPAYQRPVNTVFQNYALFPHLTVRQNVRFGLEMQGIDRDEMARRVSEALELVHLKGFEQRRPKQLSGGQQQRVALARALVNHPKVLLLDEPLGALDLKLRKAMQVELKALQEQVGITFIYVTHDQEEALTMSDRIGVMHQGKLLQVGPAREVYEAPQSRFVSDFIGDTNYLEGLVAEIRGSQCEIVIEPDMRFWGQTTEGIISGKQATLAFRPEKTTLNNDESNARNRVGGRIQEVVYTGSATTYIVQLANGKTIVSKEQNLDATLDFKYQVGSQVTVTWPVDVTKCFID